MVNHILLFKFDRFYEKHDETKEWIVGQKQGSHSVQIVARAEDSEIGNYWLFPTEHLDVRRKRSKVAWVCEPKRGSHDGDPLNEIAG